MIRLTVAAHGFGREQPNDVRWEQRYFHPDEIREAWDVGTWHYVRVLSNAGDAGDHELRVKETALKIAELIREC